VFEIVQREKMDCEQPETVTRLMSVPGPKAKYLERADDFRLPPHGRSANSCEKRQESRHTENKCTSQFAAHDTGN